MADQSVPLYGGRYAPQKLIARGGMAEVYLARDTLLERRVAVKVLFPELSVDRAFVERFRREAQAAANLSHPNIVSVYDWGEEGGVYFIVMEHVPGRSLAAALRSDGPLLADRAAAIGADIAAALAFAHRKGVIHRDIKPGNVLVTPTDQVKVTDFGIARAASGDGDLTKTGAVMGTATYFSPEQAQGLAIDQRSDLYALGVILYEMAAGRPPFVADGPVAVAYKHVNEPLVPLSEVAAPGVPTAFEAIVHKCLSKDPDNRYVSAYELRAELQRFRQGRPVLAAAGKATVRPGAGDAKAAGRNTPARAGARQRRAAVAVAGGTVDGGAAAGGAAAGGAGHPPRTATTVAPAGATDRASKTDGRDGTAATTTVATASGTTAGAPTDGSRRRRLFERTSAYVALLAVLTTLLAVVAYLLARQLDLIGSSSSGRLAARSVPSDVVGKTLEQAEPELENQGLAVSVAQESNQAPVGTVFAVDPPPGTRLHRGDRVTLHVSAGPPAITEPDVIGLSYDDAGHELQQAGLTVAPPKTQQSDSVRAGYVISQDPPPGTQLHKGDSVTLTVSTGRGSVLVPDVRGKTKEDAENALLEAGLRFRVATTREPSATVPVDSVTRTDPPTGTAVTKQTVVTLYLSSGPAKVEVPAVRGMREPDARAAIEGRGLTVSETYQSVSDPSEDGVVIGQDPEAGTMVDTGTTVRIVIGRFP